MLWFTAALVILVVGIFTINFSVSREVLDQSIQERLMDIVDTNVQEIEFYNSSKNEVEEHDFFLSYKGGILEIDDDFCAYLDGISTALIDSENNLLYGSMPILLEESEAFSFTSVGTVTQNGQRYYIYERKLSGYRRTQDRCLFRFRSGGFRGIGSESGAFRRKHGWRFEKSAG